MRHIADLRCADPIFFAVCEFTSGLLLFEKKDALALYVLVCVFDI
jgi:hypothetical protein